MKSLKNMKAIFLMLMILLASTVSAKERFRIPDSYETFGSVLPVSYLQSIAITNTNEKLKNVESRLLSCLLLDAAVKSEELYE